MFALTFLTVLLSLLSVYAQIVLASPKLDSKMAIGQSMITFHHAAASLAEVINPTGLDLNGCRLSQRTWLNAPTLCQTGPNVIPPNAVATVNLGPYKFNNITVPYLPTGYNLKSFQWNTLLFQVNSVYHVITFIASPNNIISSGPNPMEMNIKKGEVYKQFSSYLPSTAYGYVRNGTLVTGIPITYQVPPSIPEGALAIISTLHICSGC